MMYGVFHGRRIVWGAVVGLGCLLLPFVSGMVAREAAEDVAETQPVGVVERFFESMETLL